MKMNCFLLSVMTAFVTFACNPVNECPDAFVEAEDPVALTPEQAARWDAVDKGLHGAWAGTDFQYGRSTVPAVPEMRTCRLVAWKGERASAQIMLWSAGPVAAVGCEIKDFKSDVAELPSSIASSYFVRYTLADQFTPDFLKTSRYKRGKTPACIAADMLDTLACIDIPARTARPVWLLVNVPQDAPAGIYRTDVVIDGKGSRKVVLPLELEVVDHVLPSPDQWSYYLDLWQHPSSVARAHGLPMWGDEHFEALGPVMKRLADAGQKVITATLNKDPWNHQCYDAYEAMIKWTKCQDGTWKYDYSVFDRWVRFMLDIGIDKAINCYSMVPWNCELEYFDEKENEMVTVKAEPGTPVFPEIWKPFLVDFKRHLAENGWLEFTNIAMDERSPEAMAAAAKVLEECAPEMGFALADNHKSYKKFTMMRDVCVAMRQSVVSSEDILSRREKGYSTTFYVCCSPSYPNTFTTSQPYESEFFGWYNVAHDYDGMLRWAYNSWAENPQYDSRYGTWMSGDTYFVYPYNRSSIRFERLIDGIEVAEKIRQLRREGVDLNAVEQHLDKIRSLDPTDHAQPWQQILTEARAALDEASRQ